MVLGRISCALCLSLYISILYHLLRISWIPLVVWRLHLWCVEHSQLWGSVTIHVEHIFQLLFTVSLCWEQHFMTDGLPLGSWPSSLIIWWILLSASGDIRTLFGLCPLLFPYTRGTQIVLQYRMDTSIIIHIPVGPPFGLWFPCLSPRQKSHYVAILLWI